MVSTFVPPPHPLLFLVPQFLRDRDLDVDETVAKLGRYMAWRDDVKPHKVSVCV